ncbi:hypothetical protein [Vibrio sp. 10N.261.51.C6]|uniref:hypothetical protein n=1 Tax=Vibrio sp. 10N.261.51.C6 TaxID=3229676 RepID=UPI00355030A0
MSNANTALNHLQNKKIEAARCGYLDASYYKQTVNHNSIMDIALNDEIVGNDLSEALERVISLVDTTNFIYEGFNAFDFYVNHDVTDFLNHRDNHLLSYNIIRLDDAVCKYEYNLGSLIEINDLSQLSSESRKRVLHMISALESVEEHVNGIKDSLNNLKSELSFDDWKKLLHFLDELTDDMIEYHMEVWNNEMRKLENPA